MLKLIRTSGDRVCSGTQLAVDQFSFLSRSPANFESKTSTSTSSGSPLAPLAPSISARPQVTEALLFKAP